MERTTSEMILERLRQEAKHTSRPQVRAATIERLVEACNAIESGAATKLMGGQPSRRTAIGTKRKISPSSVEKYVKAKAKIDPSWTGPTRVTIQKDASLRAYVTARENEREKPSPSPPRSSRQKLLEDAICQLPSIEAQMDLRHELESGRVAKRTLNLLTAGLRQLPGIDVDQLLEVTSRSIASGRPTPTVSTSASSRADHLTTDERDILRQFVERLTDNDELNRSGLSFSNDRVQVLATKRALIKPLELRLIRRIAGIKAAGDSSPSPSECR